MASGMAWRDEIEGGSFTKIADELDRIYANLNANEFSSVKPFLSSANTAIPLGTWQDVPFDAANYGATGGGTWTVTAATQVTYSYALIGKTLHLNVDLLGTQVAGVVTNLGIRLPVGVTVAKNGRTIGVGIQGATPMSIRITFAPAVALSVDLLTGGAFAVGQVDVTFLATIPIV